MENSNGKRKNKKQTIKHKLTFSSIFGGILEFHLVLDRLFMQKHLYFQDLIVEFAIFVFKILYLVFTKTKHEIRDEFIKL